MTQIHQARAGTVTPEMQAVHAKGAGSGPVNKKTVLSPELQKGLPYGDAVAKLIAVDWDAREPEQALR